MLHPADRVSDVQRRQMTTVDAPNVHNVAIEGTFDDCQDLVKALFADAAFRDAVRLSAMNSINWARVMAQIVYYVTTVARLGRCSFAVPSGNFGNIFSGWIAERMGLPIDQLVIGSNSNDILTRWAADGSLVAAARRAHVQPLDGHPGVVQPRASPLRALRPRRRPDGRPAHAVPGHRRRGGAAERPVRRRQPR